MDDDDGTSSATMTSVTGELSLDESDTTTTSNDIDTSSQITSSEFNEEGNTTVTNTPQLPVASEPAECDGEVENMEGDSGKGEVSPNHEEHLHESPPHASVTKDSPPRTSSKRRKKRSTASAGGGGPQFPDLMSAPGNWYQHRCFDRYWRHYQFVSMWCQKHVELYRSVVQQYQAVAAQQATAAEETPASSKEKSQSQVFKKPVASRTIRNRKARRRRKAAKNRMRMEVSNAELAGSGASHGEGDSPSEETTTQSATEGAGEEEMEVEISDEMLDFFAHTHKHRQERDALKKKNKGKEEIHVNIEEAKCDHKERTMEAPTERPGSKRTSEMLQLYGKGAAMIHGMETALQMTFDRNMDVNQPAMWPNMPLRVIFG